MRKTGVVAGVAVIAGVVAMAVVQAQAPAKPAAPKPAASAPAAARYRTHGNLNQVMRGILFPNSNVVSPRRARTSRRSPRTRIRPPPPIR